MHRLRWGSMRLCSGGRHWSRRQRCEMSLKQGQALSRGWLGCGPVCRATGRAPVLMARAEITGRITPPPPVAGFSA